MLGPPKTESSYRTIPLTDTAYDILREIYDTREYRNESEGLSTVLTFMDRKTGQKRKLVMCDLVFITGAPKACQEQLLRHPPLQAVRRCRIERFC